MGASRSTPCSTCGKNGVLPPWPGWWLILRAAVTSRFRGRCGLLLLFLRLSGGPGLASVLRFRHRNLVSSSVRPCIARSKLKGALSAPWPVSPSKSYRKAVSSRIASAHRVSLRASLSRSRWIAVVASGGSFRARGFHPWHADSLPFAHDSARRAAPIRSQLYESAAMAAFAAVYVWLRVVRRDRTVSREREKG